LVVEGTGLQHPCLQGDADGNLLLPAHAR
jgi:hypothetical protein